MPEMNEGDQMSVWRQRPWRSRTVSGHRGNRAERGREFVTRTGAVGELVFYKYGHSNLPDPTTSSTLRLCPLLLDLWVCVPPLQTRAGL